MSGTNDLVEGLQRRAAQTSSGGDGLLELASVGDELRSLLDEAAALEEVAGALAKVIEGLPVTGVYPASDTAASLVEMLADRVALSERGSVVLVDTIAVTGVSLATAHHRYGNGAPSIGLVLAASPHVRFSPSEIDLRVGGLNPTSC